MITGLYIDGNVSLASARILYEKLERFIGYEHTFMTKKIYLHKRDVPAYYKFVTRLEALGYTVEHRMVSDKSQFNWHTQMLADAVINARKFDKVIFVGSSLNMIQGLNALQTAFGIKVELIGTQLPEHNHKYLADFGIPYREIPDECISRSPSPAQR